MTRRNEKAEIKAQVIAALTNKGISSSDIISLMSIARGMHKWDELECGDADGNCIERDEVTGIPYMTSEPYNHQGPRLRRKIPDTEKRLNEKLTKIMKRYPGLVAYHQGDCRGWPLYIVSDADRRGAPIDSVYNNGTGIPG